MTRFFKLALLCLFASPLNAGDAGLYPEAIDPDAGFLRVLMTGTGFVNIAGKSHRINAPGLSPFHILPSGRTEIAWAEGQTWVDLPSGRHVSLLIREGGQAEAVEDPIANHPAKADVTLINLSDVEDLVLFVPQAKTEVFTDVAPEKFATRAVRAPLTLDFEFRTSDRTLAVLSGVDLARKSGVTFLLTGSGGDYTAQALPNRYER